MRRSLTGAGVSLFSDPLLDPKQSGQKGCTSAGRQGMQAQMIATSHSTMLQ